MTRQRAQYLRRAIPRLRKKRRHPLVLITFADGQTTGPHRWTDVSTHAAANQEGHHLPALWLLTPRPPRGFWRSLFGR